MKNLKVKAFLILLAMTPFCLTSTVHAVELEELREEKVVAKDNLNSLKDQMVEVMTEINLVEEELIIMGEEMFQAEADLVKAELEVKEQEQNMNMKALEEKNTMLGGILKVFNKKEEEQLSKYLEAKNKVSKMKFALEEDAKEISEKQKILETEKKKLETMISEARATVEDLDAQIQAAAEEAFISDSRELNATLNSNGDFVTNTATGEAIVAAAKQYLGIPYRWGGMSRSGVDCSGLTALAHRAVGIGLSHSSGAQGRGGKRVSRADLMPGDLVCYSGHVGIYVGNGKMIHAPQTGDVVRIVEIYGNPWFRRYW